MKERIKEIQKILEPFNKQGITRNSLEDYAITAFPRGMMHPLTPEIREKVESQLDNVLLNNKNSVGFYIHFEICTRKCSGCHYGSITTGDKEQTVKAILEHIDLFPSNRYFVDTSIFYFGGGTPSLMSVAQIKLIYDKIVNKFNIKNVEGATLELHPEVVRLKNNPNDYIKQLKEMGITRISLGVQDSDDRILKEWGRGHTIDEALKTFGLLKKHKIKTNIDLIWHFPNQTLENLERSLRTVLNLNPDGICTYFFWLRPGTKDFNLYKNGKLKLLNNSIEMKFLIKSITAEYGYRQGWIDWYHKEKSTTEKIFNKIKHNISVNDLKKDNSVDSLNLIVINFGPSSYTFLFSGLEDNYFLWSPVPKDLADTSASNDYREMLNAGIKPYDRVVRFDKEDTIRIYTMFSLRAKRLSKEILNYLIDESRDRESEVLVNNYLKRGLLIWDEKGRLSFTDAGDMIPNYISATFLTDECLTEMMKTNVQEDRYYWFPSAEKVLKLKKIIKSEAA